VGGRDGGVRPRCQHPQGRRPRAGLGIDTGISKSEVSRICGELDAVVGAFRERRLDHAAFPYVFLDATYVKAHEGASVVSKAIVIATGVTATGDREVLGLAVGDSEDGAFWTAFARSLRARGLGGVRLVISDAHQGLKAAIATVFIGAAWQRCRVHFLRNVLARIQKGRAEMVLALIRTIWAQPDPAAVREQLDAVADKLAAGFLVVAAMLREAREDVTAFAAFPFAHWKRSGAPTRSSGSTRRSSAAATWSGSFPTRRRSCAWRAPCCSRSTTSGPSRSGATSPRAPWRCLTGPPMMG
jgi:transposase-like protein